MLRDQRVVSHRTSGLPTAAIYCAINCAVAIALLFTAPDALSQAAGQTATAPENPFSRWFKPPATAAAPAPAQPAQRIRKPRIAKSGKRAKPAAAVAQSVPTAETPIAKPEEPVTESGWPNAEATLGTAMITPLTVKTVREQVEPKPESLVVSESDVSDIDRAAQPAQVSSPVRPASTDGSGTVENETDRAQVFAFGESMKAMTQSAWAEPILLMLAGALAGLAASRLFV
jgi:hypothetical protein